MKQGNILMHRQILKRRGNYILRDRIVKDNNLIYVWMYSKELSNILKKYGKIEDWQFANVLEALDIHTYTFNLHAMNTIKFSFRNLFKYTQETSIKSLLQYSNKVGEYA